MRSNRVGRYVAGLLLMICAEAAMVPDEAGARPYLAQYFKDHPIVGIASWYGQREAGRKTASGTVFDPAIPSAAHRSLPLGTCVRVTRLESGQSVTVPITDRGPYIRGRMIDLSRAAAERIGMIQSGLARVRMDIASGCEAAHPL